MNIIVICGARSSDPAGIPDRVGVGLANALAQQGCRVFCLRRMAGPWSEAAQVYLTFGFADADELSRQLEDLNRFEAIDAVVDADQACNLRAVRRAFPETKVAALVQTPHAVSLPGVDQLSALLLRWLVGVPLTAPDGMAGQGRA